MNKPTVIEAKLTGNEFENVDRISLVKRPAIEIDWMAFGKEHSNFSVDWDDDKLSEHLLLEQISVEQKESYRIQNFDSSKLEEFKGQRLLVAPAMVTDKLILRRDKEDDPYWIYFTAESIRNAAYAFQRLKLTDSFNIEHDSQQIAEGVYLAETWLVEEPETDKSRFYGFNLPKGSWMTILKVDNEDLWSEYIESGTLKGLSVEAYVINRVVFDKVNNDVPNTNN